MKGWENILGECIFLTLRERLFNRASHCAFSPVSSGSLTGRYESAFGDRARDVSAGVFRVPFIIVLVVVLDMTAKPWTFVLEASSFGQHSSPWPCNPIKVEWLNFSCGRFGLRQMH